MPRKLRLREHVNPLTDQYRDPVVPPDWTSIYADWNLPLSVDLGSGEGEYLLQMAQDNPQWNYLGLEIRRSLVDYGNQLRLSIGLTNLHFLFCNITPSLALLLPPGKVRELTIQFPDPWFKRRHQKRRLIQPVLIKSLTKLLIPGAKVLIQSDVLDTAKTILIQFDTHPQFHNLAGVGLFSDSSCYPDHIATEREKFAISKNRQIYRMVFEFQRVDAN